MNTLLHACCAPCSIKCIEALKAEGIDTKVLWFNPNIHPFTEYQKRLTTLKDYLEAIGIVLYTEDNYGLREFIGRVGDNLSLRCVQCYKMRMDAAAKFAKERGFHSFTTTLLISPYQNHELLCEAGELAAREHNIEFLYRDFRPYFREGQRAARESGLYMQKYCGCIFSEEERYLKK